MLSSEREFAHKRVVADRSGGGGLPLKSRYRWHAYSDRRGQEDKYTKNRQSRMLYQTS